MLSADWVSKRTREVATAGDGRISAYVLVRPHLVLRRRGPPEEAGFISACLLSERASFDAAMASVLSESRDMAEPLVLAGDSVSAHLALVTALELARR